MFFQNYFREVQHHFEEAGSRRVLVSLMAFYFLILFTYPFPRASATSLFLEYYGASQTPVAWTISILCLSIAVSFYNALLEKHGCKRLIQYTIIISAALFALHYFLLPFLPKVFVGTFYVLKEVYIILLVHLAWSYSNHYFKFSHAKVLYGVIAACGSLGGICGGFLVKEMTNLVGTEMMPLFTSGLMVLSLVVVNRLDDVPFLKQENFLGVKPLQAIEGIKSYVVILCLLIGFGQIIVNIGELQFNTLFEKHVVDRDARTTILASLYAYTNIFTLIFKLFFFSYILRRIQLKFYHYSIPLGHAVVLFFLFGPMASLPFLGAGYVLLKGIDYAVFGIGKELLYFPLTAKQKYGAKYVADMIFYRFSKGLVSFILIFFQNFMILRSLLVAVIISWFFLVYLLFRQANKQRFAFEYVESS